MSKFFAFLSRMKYIKRWSLMRSIREENIMEHSLEVSILAHALAVIKNKIFGANVNDLSYAPDFVSRELADAFIEAVNCAYEYHFYVTAKK